MNHTPKGQIYADLLLPLQHGHPLWLPKPTKHSLPKEYRRQGVQIGDVGVITSDGGFEFLFNVCLPADHPINQFRGTPSNFTPIRWNGPIHQTPNYFRPGELICSRSSERLQLPIPYVNVLLRQFIPSDLLYRSPAGTERPIVLRFRNRRGAVLMLPNGASRFDCGDVAVFRRYADMNAPNWYRFFRVTLGREPENGSLRLVTGFDKSDSWTMALVDSDRSPSPSLIFYKKDHGRLSLEELSRSSVSQSPITIRCSTSVMKNQTLFLRAHPILLRGSELVWRRNPEATGAQRYSLPSTLPIRNVYYSHFNYLTPGSSRNGFLNDSDGYSSDTSEHYTAKNINTIDEEHDYDLPPSRSLNRSWGAVDDSILRDVRGFFPVVTDDSDVAPLTETEEFVNLLRSTVEPGENGFEDVLIGLQDADAQRCVDLIQDVIDKFTTEYPELRQKAHRLLVKLSRSQDVLPSTLFIKGIELRDTNAQFGGAFGDIYRAVYRDLEVAIKRMRVFPSTPESNRQKLYKGFCREAILWRALKHPYVLPFLGVDSETFPGSFCLISPWMKNGTVLDYLRKTDGQDIDLRLFEIAQGLAYLHSQEIVHGDLRGSNILVDSKCHACIADFGLSVFSDGTVRTDSSHHGGSVRWMAPELHDPARFRLEYVRRTFASDVYSFACVCVELYTGKRPFAGIRHDTGAILQVIVGKRPKWPPHMEAWLWSIVETCWDHDRAKRPSVSRVVEMMQTRCPGGTLIPLHEMVSLNEAVDQGSQRVSILKTSTQNTIRHMSTRIA
ncbi:kinase-likeprotein [Moniliophthora roreri MCA 2997]|uniref:Kinase-likeprotein n=1 Tax=Moniliophthora roreri (strain MCA 2997) TaxID=1381753 RepID=V2Y0V7_MONRO|nr:kinase-likeprotein [Moniliophthora roreri MCA 2997]